MSKTILSTDGRCIVCRVVTNGTGAFRSYCSRICQTESYRWPNGRPVRDCVKCGEPIDFNQVRPGGRKLRADTRKCFNCRRDQILVTAVELADRDGTDCSLCEQPINMALKWPDRMAPTRDHVIPWSLGGTNEASNLALAHFVCNIRKKNSLAP